MHNLSQERQEDTPVEHTSMPVAQSLVLNQVVFGLRSGVLGASNNRMGIWTQGCSLNKCEGCASVHTWTAAKGFKVPVAALLAKANSLPTPPDGLTISGGEPTDQAVPLVAFIKEFRRSLPTAEIVLYTGRTWSDAEAHHPDLLELVDVVVAGPYRSDLPPTPLAGSSNQEIRLLTPLAARLYEGWQNWPLHLQQATATGDGRVVSIGIPDLERLQEAAREVQAVRVSWQRRPKVNNSGLDS